MTDVATLLARVKALDARDKAHPRQRSAYVQCKHEFEFAAEARTLLPQLAAALSEAQEEIRKMRECPMILCPFEEENVKLRQQLAALAPRTEAEK